MQKRIQLWLQEVKFFRGVAFSATLIVIYLSLKPPSPDSEPWSFFFIRGDLLLHFGCYFGMYLLYFFALFTVKKTVPKAIILSLLLGLLLEIAQLIPYFKRFFDVQDLLANMMGVYVGVIFQYFLFPFSKEN